MKELEAYKEMLKKMDSFLDKKGSLRISKFIRSNFDNIKEIQKRGFQLKEIVSCLSENLNSEVNYASFWSSMKRHSEKLRNESNTPEREKTTLSKEIKKEKLNNDVNVEKEKSVSDEIKNTEEKPDLEWIKKPEFEHINRDQIIDVIIEYGITEQEVIDLKLPLYTLKCLDILISYGEKKKAEAINRIYFGN